MKVLTFTLRLIGVVQVLLGTVFLTIPNQFATLVGLQIPPAWVLWMFGNLGARFLGFGYGMFLAAENPSKHRSWIKIMVLIQVIDWIYVIYHLIAGSITFSQAATAPILPIVFIAVLVPHLWSTRGQNE